MVRVFSTLGEAFRISFTNKKVYYATLIMLVYGILASTILKLFYDHAIPTDGQRILRYVVLGMYFFVLFFILGAYIRNALAAIAKRENIVLRPHGWDMFKYVAAYLLFVVAVNVIVYTISSFIDIENSTTLLYLLIGYALVATLFFVFLLPGFFIGIAELFLHNKKVVTSIKDSILFVLKNKWVTLKLTFATVLVLAIGYYPTYIGIQMLGPFTAIVMFVDVLQYSIFVVFPTMLLLLAICWLIHFYLLYYAKMGEKQ